MNRAGRLMVGLIGAASTSLAGCGESRVTSSDEATAADAAFAELQERGEQAMGVDQETPRHVFDALADGGRIELQRAVEDSIGVARIRQHFEQIARAFGGGEFNTPAFVHMQRVPGSSVMAAKRGALTYMYRELPRGGEVRMVTQDPAALEAIHEFLAFQREDHRAGGMEHDRDGREDGHGGHDSGAHHSSAHQRGTHRGGTHAPGTHETGTHEAGTHAPGTHGNAAGHERHDEGGR